MYSARRVLGFPGSDGGLLYSLCDQLRHGSVHLGAYHGSQSAVLLPGLDLLGRWVERRQAGKQYFLLGNVSAAVLGCSLFFLADCFPAVAVLYPLFGFMAGCIPTVLDAWVIVSFPERKDAAGRSGCPGNIQRGHSADCHRVLSLDFPGWKTKAESIRNLLLCVNVKT